MNLVKEARLALGTTNVTATVHAALDEVVRRRHRLALVGFVPAVDLSDLDRMRSHRFAEVPKQYRSDPG
jgi:hypothetical protein